jgi:hypothetical protein
MEHYVGLDVSLKLIAICIVDRQGKIEREGVVPSDAGVGEIALGLAMLKTAKRASDIDPQRHLTP